MYIRCLPRSSIRSSSNCLSTAVIASNLDSRLHLYPEITTVSLVSKTSWFIPPPSLTPRFTAGRYSWTHNPPSGPGDSRHVRGSASAISSRIKTGSCAGEAGHVGNPKKLPKNGRGESRSCKREETRVGSWRSYRELERERRERHNLIVSRLEFAQIRVSKPGSSRLEHVCTRRASFICRVDLPTLLLNYRASSYIRFAARNLVGTLLSLSLSLSSATPR